MDENLAKLVKRLKVIRKELKEAVNIPHQVEFIEDINNILKPVALELTMIVSNIDAVIVENIELLKESKKQQDKVDNASLTEHYSITSSSVPEETNRIKDITGNLNMLVKPTTIFEKYLPALFSKDGPLDNVKRHAAYLISEGAKGKHYLANDPSGQTISLYPAMEITDSYDSIEGTRQDDFDRIKIITTNYQVQMQRYARDEVEWSHAVSVYHKSGGGQVRFTEYTFNEFLIELITRVDLLILPENIVVSEEYKQPVVSVISQYAALKAHLEDLFKPSGMFKAIINHVRYITAVNTGLIPKKEFNINKFDLTILTFPLACEDEKALGITGIGSDGVISIGTANYVLKLIPNTDVKSFYPYDFKIYTHKGFDWVLVNFTTEEKVKDFLKELSDYVGVLTTA